MGTPADDPTIALLSRHVYWAQEGHARTQLATRELRDRILEFAAQMRTDERMVIPHGEGNLASRSRLKRRMKYSLFHLARPISWRYDRLLGDLADLVVGLSERVIVLEGELERLRGVEDGGPAPNNEGNIE